MGKKRQGLSWRTRALGAAVLALLAFAAWSWWHLRHWAPDAALWPDQGAEISADDGPVSMPALKAIGAHFVYLDATNGGAGRDAAFARNLAEARAAGLRVGAVLRFDPCRPADAQSAAFALTVPRGRELLPPAIALDRVADECPAPVTEAAIESELMTLVNQVEAHAGRQVILQPSKAFEDRYRLAGRIERNLWVTGTWREPTYAGRPWLMWTANTALMTEAAGEPLRWVVVRP